LNCNCDLTAFGGIVPCGIADAGVTSLTKELGREIAPEDVIDRVAEAVCEVLGAPSVKALGAAALTSTP